LETQEAGAKTGDPTAGFQAETGREGDPQDNPQGESPKPKISALHTLKGDISEYIKNKGMSFADIAAAASKRRRLGETESQSKKILFLTGIILLIAGLAAAGWLFFFKEKPAPNETILQPPRPPILSENQQIIDLKSEKRSELIDAIQTAAETDIGPGTILNFPFLLEANGTKEYIQAKKFFGILGINLPINLNQSLEDSFTFGVFNNQIQNEPFLILKINSFDFAFSGVLDWEKNMAGDLKEIMSIENIPPPNKKFEDKVIKNWDARILYDDSNNAVIGYAFVKSQYLVITADISTLEEIIRRFSL
jgi:hypothetical protein